jgi:hypothetical protein
MSARPLIRHEDTVWEIPNDGDPRWQELLESRSKVLSRFGPLPAACAVKDMVVFCITRKIPAGEFARSETIYMASPEDIERLGKLPEKWLDCVKLDSYASDNPGLTVSELLTLAERGEFKYELE